MTVETQQWASREELQALKAAQERNQEEWRDRLSRLEVQVGATSVSLISMVLRKLT